MRKSLLVMLVLATVIAIGSGSLALANNIAQEEANNQVTPVAQEYETDLSMPKDATDIQNWHNTPEHQKLHQEMINTYPEMEEIHQQMMGNNADTQVMHNAHHGLQS